MLIDTIKAKWDKLLEEGLIHFYQEQNKEMIWNGKTMTFCMEYVPERAKRVGCYQASTHPLGDNIINREDCLYDFGELALLANNRPVEKYHSILCSKSFIPQNEFTKDEIMAVSKIVEETGIRSFFNMRGTAATLEHFHTQVLWNQFHIENLVKVSIDENIGYLPDYPVGNILFTGELSKRCDLLFEKLKLLSESKLPLTVKDDGNLSKTPLFTLLFWENNILLIPRKQETSSRMKAMVGGLELSGYFLITAPLARENPFEGVDEKYLIEIIREVAFEKEDINFLY
ncbi:hypothetical protein [Lachnotalea glycerini]|uniref:Uncharacterized protein n=1 Tax=Lachnotalea glycerini TaxID=1763509 RepID=A0A371JJI9_9FIRM|nr:hypothetical protein [Lachnotalea glycerini]RDY32905.1 hypothetical protein CG710_002920 [Lachnotalea glycerini]